ncbi:MAG: hypothetical protein H7230_04280 [Candidatus Parcubacteria bacterium]|nr:hypothetical protein [Candidatus Paceibacterota bacterium]
MELKNLFRKFSPATLTSLILTSCLSPIPPDNFPAAVETLSSEVKDGIKANPQPIVGPVKAVTGVIGKVPRTTLKASVLDPNHPQNLINSFRADQQKNEKIARLKAAEVAAVENAAIKNQNEINRREVNVITTPFDPGAAAMKAEEIRLKELEDYYKKNPGQRALDNPTGK